MAVPPTFKLNEFYGHSSQDAAGASNVYSIATLAGRHSVYIERTRTSLADTRAYRSAGYNGLILLYIIAQAQNPSTGTVYGNQIVITQAEYNALPSTAFIYTDAARTTRKVRNLGTGIALQYYTDPASTEIRQLMLKRMVESLNANPELDGIFLDNVGELENYDATASYPGSASVAGDGTTAGTAYTMAGFIVQEKACYQYLRDNITSADFTGGRTTFIFAGNMLWDNSQTAWNTWTMFDGLMIEDVVGYTNSGHFKSAAGIADTLAGANAFYALSSTKFLINAHQQPLNSSAAANRYGLATAALWMPTTNSTTLGGRTFPRWTYRPLTVGAYTRWLEYADFDLVLGAPSGAHTLTGGLYERTFATGSIKSNPTGGTVSGVTTRTGVITATAAPPPSTVPLAVAGSKIEVRGDAVTSLAFTIPTVVQLNDVYTIWVEVRNVAESTVTVTLTDWTVVSAATINQSGAGALRGFQRTMDWDDPGKAYTVTFSSANDAAVTGDASRGADPISPIDNNGAAASAATNNITTDTATVPAITTTSTNTRLVADVMWPVGVGKTLAAPTSMNATKVAEAVGTATIVIHAAVWDQTVAAAGTVAAKTSVMTPAQGANTRHFAAIMALKPKTAEPPGAPSNLVPMADALTGDITVSWSLPSETLLDLLLWESVDGGAFALVSPQPAETDTEIVLSRTPGTYAYRMAAQGAGGWSPRTATVSVALDAPPPPADTPLPVVVPGTKVSVAIYDATGALLTSVSATAHDLQWSEGKHGTAACTMLLSGEDATIVNRAFHFGNGAVTVRISNATVVLWQGEIEDATILNDRLEVTAFGAWSKLALVPYTEFWSSTMESEWARSSVQSDWTILPPYSTGGLIANLSDLFAVSTDPWGALRFAPRFDVLYSSTALGGAQFIIPDMAPGISRRTIKQVQIDYSVTRYYAAQVFELALRTYDNGVVPASGTPRWTLSTAAAGPGGEYAFVSGSATVQIPEDTITSLVFTIRASTPGSSGYGTGDLHGNVPLDGFRVTRIRVLSTTAATITPDLIVQDIIAHTNLFNPGTLSTSTAAIAGVPLDLENLSYTTANAQDVLTELASYGMPTSVDDNDPNTVETPPVPMEVGVGPTGVLFFRSIPAAGSADMASSRTVRELFLDGPPVEVRYSTSKIINGAYGQVLITDEASRARYGRLRIRTAPTAGSIGANQGARLLIAENTTPKPGVEVRAGMLVEGGEARLFDAYGSLVPLWQVRRGDWLVIPVPKLGPLPQADNVFRIRIVEVQYVATPTPQLTLMLEDSPPRLTIQLASLLAGK